MLDEKYIQPNNASDYENSILRILSKAKKNIENKKIDLSLEKIIKLNDSDKFFKIWIQQAKLYLDFKSTFDQIKEENV